jgi:hypothetical protein
MFNPPATNGNKYSEPIPAHYGAPDSEDAKHTPLPGTLYEPYSEKPALAEPPYTPYAEKPAANEPPYEPYKGI